ncbi:MAG: DsrH/TusB family sulfur metabolism protein [Desulfitobacteriaceae bacterium]
MKKVLCLISSPPESVQVTRGLALAREWVKKGHTVQICLLQDGIYSAITGSAILDDETLPRADWFVLADDLQLRGFTSQNLRPGIHTLNYPDLVKMMMENADQVLGAF